MKFNYEGHSFKGGIYKILNAHNGRVYIGSTSRFQTRWWNGHAKSLLKGKHQNRFLQADFNKCREELGHDDFLEFHVVQLMEESSKESRKVIEQEWIDRHFDNGNQCYNLKQKVVLSRGDVPSKNPEETKRKLSESAKRNWENPQFRLDVIVKLTGVKKPPRSEQHRQNLSLSHRGLQASDETKKKISESHKTEKCLYTLRQTYEKHRAQIIARVTEAVSLHHQLVSPTGELVEVVNLNKWCKEHGMHSSGFSNLKRKKDGTTYKGWKYIGTIEKKMPNETRETA